MVESNAAAGDDGSASTAHIEKRLIRKDWGHAARRRCRRSVQLGVGHDRPITALPTGGTAAIAENRRAAIRPQLTWLHWLVVGAASVLVYAFISPVATYAPALRAAVETMIVIAGLTSAWLLKAQFARTRRYRDLVLFGSLLMFALVEFLGYLLPAALDVSAGTLGTLGLWGSALAAAALAHGAFTPAERTVGGDRRPVALVAVGSVVAVGAAEVLSLAFGGALTSAVNRPIPGIALALKYPPAAILAAAIGALLALAALALARAHRREPGLDSRLALLAGAAVLLAAARFYSLPLPWLSPDWISPRDAVRLLAFVLVLAAVIRHELLVHAGIARAAAAAERRRVAQDLHDSLAQDLALIAAHGPMMANHFGGEHPVIVAAQRALAVSRGTINHLSDPGRSTTREALEAVADELRSRFKIAITVTGDLEAEPAPHVRQDLCRIAREAIANAARHGGAGYVIVTLRQTPQGITMTVSDDGLGIRVLSSAEEGFGIGSMRERVAALGGQLTIKRSSKRGTELEATVP
jgi:signal transduction histidine kinase